MTGLGNMDDVYRHYLVVIEENRQLKELLKECKYFLDECDNDFSWDDCVKGYHLGETIDKIIGEKK
jgi:hypothetical protein